MPSRPELDRRLSLVRKAMRDESLDILVAISDARHNEQQGDVRYLSGVALWCPQKPYIVIPAESEPVMVVGMPSEAYWIRNDDIPWKDIRWNARPIEEVVDVVSDVAGNGGRVGVSGLSTLMPRGDHDFLIERLAGIDLVDATHLMEGVRRIKSAEEIEALKESARIAELAVEVIEGTDSAGRSERNLAVEVDTVARSLGASDILILTSPGPYLRPPTDRKLKARDFQMFSLELSGPSGYWTETSTMLSMGDPIDRDLKLYQTCRDAFDAGVRRLRPGATCSSVALAVQDVVGDGPYSLGIWGGHGIGLDIPEDPSLVKSADRVIEDGMAFAFHPHIIDSATQHAAYISGSFHIEDSGATPLGNRTEQLFVS
jgi:Xaa-Pro dipeptidase